MGISNSPAQFATKCFAAGQAMEEVSKTATATTALAIKKAILANTPARLSGVGRRGAKLGVRYNIGNYPDGSKALIYATGPFHLIERDTVAHVIAKRKGRRGKVLHFGSSAFFASVKHPGTKGKHPFARGTAEGFAVAGQIQKRETQGVLKSIF